MLNDLRNIKHRCADYAYYCIKDVKPDIKQNYYSEVRSTGTKIFNSGLMQTLTFYLSKMKKGEHFKKLLLHLLKWILDGEVVNSQPVSSDSKRWDEDDKRIFQLYESLLSKTEKEMMYYTQRALMVSEWLSSFAEAMLK